MFILQSLGEMVIENETLTINKSCIIFVTRFLFISALLLEAQSTPFQVTPSTMANIVKGLYTLRPGKHSPFV